MARALPEWQGRTPDTRIPTRVKDRICKRQGDCCDECRLPFDAKRRAEFDHRPALINSGENRESMIVAVCCLCHRARTKADVAEKSQVAGSRSRRLGFKKSKRPFPGSRASGLKKHMDGSVTRRATP